MIQVRYAAFGGHPIATAYCDMPGCVSAAPALNAVFEAVHTGLGDEADFLVAKADIPLRWVLEVADRKRPRLVCAKHQKWRITTRVPGRYAGGEGPDTPCTKFDETKRAAIRDAPWPGDEEGRDG